MNHKGEPPQRKGRRRGANGGRICRWASPVQQHELKVFVVIREHEQEVARFITKRSPDRLDVRNGYALQLNEIDLEELVFVSYQFDAFDSLPEGL
jgi:hypothetical protein